MRNLFGACGLLSVAGALALGGCDDSSRDFHKCGAACAGATAAGAAGAGGNGASAGAPAGVGGAAGSGAATSGGVGGSGGTSNGTDGGSGGIAGSGTGGSGTGASDGTGGNGTGGRGASGSGASGGTGALSSGGTGGTSEGGEAGVAEGANGGSGGAPVTCTEGTTPRWCTDKCVDTDSDYYHCGDCDTPCTSLAALCVGGKCSDCPKGCAVLTALFTAANQRVSFTIPITPVDRVSAEPVHYRVYTAAGIDYTTLMVGGTTVTPSGYWQDMTEYAHSGDSQTISGFSVSLESRSAPFVKNIVYVESITSSTDAFPAVNFPSSSAPSFTIDPAATDTGVTATIGWNGP